MVGDPGRLVLSGVTDNADPQVAGSSHRMPCEEHRHGRERDPGTGRGGHCLLSATSGVSRHPHQHLPAHLYLLASSPVCLRRLPGVTAPPGPIRGDG